MRETSQTLLLSTGFKTQKGIMSCNCKLYQRRIDKLQKKYSTLKKNYRKLLGVTVLLTEAIEEFIKGEVNTAINDTLSTCSSIYPDLFNAGNDQDEKMDVKPDDNSGEIVKENGKMFEIATESEREYFEGFMARPKIPRTPQV